MGDKSFELMHVCLPRAAVDKRRETGSKMITAMLQYLKSEFKIAISVMAMSMCMTSIVSDGNKNRGQI